jgi:hypothetical protein
MRNRDILALIGCLVLSRMAWNDYGTESLSATANLAFFIPRNDKSSSSDVSSGGSSSSTVTTAVTPFDVDGDGTHEAIVVVKWKNNDAGTSANAVSFVLQVLDLKALHSYGKTFLAPFRPEVIFESPEVNDSDHAYPISLTSGQVLIRKPGYGSNSNQQRHSKPIVDSNGEPIEYNDRNRHYFCGTDWHDAATKCSVGCPSGQAHECPEDERCFADTPCDALGQHAPTDTHNELAARYELTPGGGLPSIVTLWSNGLVTLHSLTNEKSNTHDNSNNNQEGAATASRRARQKQQQKSLDLREMWRSYLFPHVMDVDELLWEESNVLFLDATASAETKAEHGVIIIAGSYYLDGDVDSTRSTFTVAIDALSGQSVWESRSDLDAALDQEDVPLPVVRGNTSFARRRSAIAHLMQEGASSSALSKASAAALPNCLSLLKQHVKEVLPYSYWGPNDAGLAAIHLNHKKRTHKDNNHLASKPHEAQAARAGHPPTVGESQKKWHHRFSPRQLQKRHHHGPDDHLHPINAKPNALVSQTKGGISVRSLKNGKAVCHLSLLEETLYSDLNNDGVIDQVQVLLHNKQNDPSDKFVWQLVNRLQQEHKDVKETSDRNKKKLMESRPTLCHALTLSGIPSKEEIFSAPICGSSSDRAGGVGPLLPSNKIDAINPLVVESLNGRRNTRDVVVALNSGMIHRLHGTTGRKEWALSGNKNHEHFPTWEEGSHHNVLLTRIQSPKVSPPIRPILLAGENSLAVLSVKTGAVLANAVFPQLALNRPILADVSGDGSTDVIVFTQDAIWGFQIAVYPGSPVTLRILVGLLFMGLMLCFIRNRYSNKNKRSTDA